MRGVIHERWNITRFVSGEIIAISPFHVGTNHQSTFIKFIFKIDEVMHFNKNEKIQPTLKTANDSTILLTNPILLGTVLMIMESLLPFSPSQFLTFGMVTPHMMCP